MTQIDGIELFPSLEKISWRFLLQFLHLLDVKLTKRYRNQWERQTAKTLRYLRNEIVLFIKRTVAHFRVQIRSATYLSKNCSHKQKMSQQLMKASHEMLVDQILTSAFGANFLHQCVFTASCKPEWH